MDISIFLAKAFSLYLIVISVSMFINMDRFKAMVIDFTKSDGLWIFGSLIGLILGIILILIHNLWQHNWTMVITLLSWTIFIKGFTSTLFPKWNIAWVKKFIAHKSAYNISTAITLLVGLYLAYYGFVVY